MFHSLKTYYTVPTTYCGDKVKKMATVVSSWLFGIPSVTHRHNQQETTNNNITILTYTLNHHMVIDSADVVNKGSLIPQNFQSVWM